MPQNDQDRACPSGVTGEVGQQWQLTWTPEQGRGWRMSSSGGHTFRPWGLFTIPRSIQGAHSEGLQEGPTALGHHLGQC